MRVKMNKAIIIGRLGKDPEVKSFDNGGSVTNLSVATSNSWKDKETGEKKEKTVWHNVQVWGRTGENCAKYLAKGRQVAVEGEMDSREYDKDGETRRYHFVRATNVQFLSGQSSESAKDASTSKPAGNFHNHAPGADNPPP